MNAEDKIKKAYVMIWSVILVLFVLAFTGWVKNLCKLSDLDFKAPYKAEVIRIVGIVPPVGAVVGWFDLEGDAIKE